MAGTEINDLNNDEKIEAGISLNMMTYPEVRDAAISYKDDVMSLALQVSYATNKRRAKELGDAFVRMVKALTNGEDPPGKEIGKGRYTYIIGVYRPKQEQVVVLGVKADDSERIKWIGSLEQWLLRRGGK